MHVGRAGAGDLFASGFLAGVLAGRPLRSCAQLGCLAGAAVLQASTPPNPPPPFIFMHPQCGGNLVSS